MPGWGKMRASTMGFAPFANRTSPLWETTLQDFVRQVAQRLTSTTPGLADDEAAALMSDADVAACYHNAFVCADDDTLHTRLSEAAEYAALMLQTRARRQQFCRDHRFGVQPTALCRPREARDLPSELRFTHPQPRTSHRYASFLKTQQRP